jgi:hypothetical protein
MSLGVYGHVPDDLDQDVAGRLHRLFMARAYQRVVTS